MKVNVIPFVIGVLGTLPINLFRDLKRLGFGVLCLGHPNQCIVKIDQTNEKKLVETCCHLDSIERPPANAGVKKLQRVIIIKVIILPFFDCIIFQECIFPTPFLKYSYLQFPSRESGGVVEIRFFPVLHPFLAKDLG